MKKYTKKDFLDYATAFDYTDDYKKQMKSWSLKDFQEFYGFSYNKDD